MPTWKKDPGEWVLDLSVVDWELSVAWGSGKVTTVPNVPSGIVSLTSLSGRQTGGVSSTVEQTKRDNDCKIL